jgi:cell division septation protein DedD
MAEPGDASGVADAIRARVEAGGTGSSGSSGSSGGAGVGGASSGGAGAGAAGRSLTWLPWLSLAGLVLVVAVAGAAAGFSGALGRPGSGPARAADVAGIAASVGSGVQAFGCPGGGVATSLAPGTRVLAVERSDSGSWLGIRDPYELTRTVWLPAGAVVVADGQPALDTLPIGGCPAPSSEPPSAEPTATPSEQPSAEPTATPEPTVATTPRPTPTATPKAADKTRPSISAGAWTVSPVYGLHWNCGLSHSQIKIVATDNVGVTGVSATSTFPGATLTLASHSGSDYVFVFQMPATNPATGSTSVTFTARDAAGNKRAVTVSLAVNYCLI